MLVLTGGAAHAQDTLRKKEVNGDSIVAYARTFMGTPYSYGCCNPKSGFDCSGFTYYVYGHFGIEVPRASAAYGNFGKKIPIDSARKGDIIVFTGTKRGDKRPGHVGIVVSEKGQSLQFIHASSSKKHCGVVLTDYYNSEYPRRFIKVIRVL
ncbi:MAG: hypothetical protein Fur0041_15850 [Bacteroidia bacterium]